MNDLLQVTKINQRLPKKEIMRLKNDFDLIFKNGRRKSGKYLSILYANSDKRLIGFTVPKKFGNAVKRNRIKRLMREAVRKTRHSIGTFHLVLLPLKSAGSVSCSDLEKDFCQLIDKTGIS